MSSFEMPCPQCGKHIPLIAKRCPYCTSKLEGDPEWAKSQLFWFKGMLIVLVLAVAFLLYIMQVVSGSTTWYIVAFGIIAVISLGKK